MLKTKSKPKPKRNPDSVPIAFDVTPKLREDFKLAQRVFSQEIYAERGIDRHVKQPEAFDLLLSDFFRNAKGERKKIISELALADRRSAA